MLERYNPILRLVCLALAGLILYQISRLAFQRDAVARARIEEPMPRLQTTNKANVETNAPAKSTNSAAISTNSASVSSTNSTAASTNAAAVKTNGPVNPMAQRMAMGPRRGPGGAPQMNLPADVQAMIDKIRQSQLLGPDIKPPPMALMGIAGKDVFLRGPNGQTGIIREGEELGGVKLIRIGTNRVVVEENGQQKELTIFSGFGSETLLEKKDKP
jgi:hypothetical protein